MKIANGCVALSAHFSLFTLCLLISIIHNLFVLLQSFYFRNTLKNLPLFLIIVLLPCVLKSQQFDNAVVWGGNQDDNASRIIQDSGGDFYVLGSYSGNANLPLGQIQGYGFQDISLIKFSSDGSAIWQIGIGGSGTDQPLAITFDADGNVLLAGRFQGSIDVDPGSAQSIINSNPSGSLDGFIARYDSGTGALLEQFDLTSGGTIDIRSMQTSANGDIYIAGQFAQTVDFDFGPGTTQVISNVNSGDAFIGKYNSSLQLQWVNPIGSFTPAIDYFSDLKLSPDGGVYVTGLLGGQTDINPGVGQTILTAAIDACLIKYDQLDGSLEWGFLIGGSSVDLGVTLMLTDEMDIIVSGSMNSTSMDVDPGPGVTTISKTGSAAVPFVLRYSSNAAYLNGFAYGDGGASALNVNRIIPSYGGTILVMGNFTGNVDIDPGAGSEVLTSQDGSPDAFFVQYDANWQLNRFIHFSGPGSEVLNDGIVSGLYLYGAAQFEGDCFPDAEETEVLSPVSAGLDAAFMIWNTNPEVLNTNNSLDPEPIVIYPNPANENVWIRGQNPDAEVWISDLSGRIIKRPADFDALKGMNTAELADGLYILKVLNSDGTVFTKQLIISHK